MKEIHTQALGLRFPVRWDQFPPLQLSGCLFSFIISKSCPSLASRNLVTYFTSAPCRVCQCQKGGLSWLTCKGSYQPPISLASAGSTAAWWASSLPRGMWGLTCTGTFCHDLDKGWAGGEHECKPSATLPGSGLKKPRLFHHSPS